MEVLNAMGAKVGDLVFIVADTDKIVLNALGALRLEVAKARNLKDNKEFNFVWITEFPQ